MRAWERRAPARQQHVGPSQEDNGLAGARRSQDNRSYARGWHSRGYLPHFDAPGVIQHITYRLADSLPKEALARIEQELPTLPVEKQDIERRRRIEAYLDAGHGSCVLGRPAAAKLVIETWLRFDGERYRLPAFVVMPNHCHVLIECLDGCSLGKIVNSWKTYTARWINAHVIGAGCRVGYRAGARRSQGGSQGLWQRDYWDRYIRDERHFHAAKAYIENNPVAAGLVTAPEDWPWGSACEDAQRTLP